MSSAPHAPAPATAASSRADDAPSSGAEATGRRGPALPYNPSLDGIRAVSIVGIMANHGGLGWAAGGFISVNVFFVLSGYLITALLVKEWMASSTISLRRFWARRARRLLPALFALLAGIALYAWLFAPAQTRGAIRTDALSTLFYVANWHQILSGQSYFAQGALPSPLLHTWTLAIEEQFYLIWPLLVLGTLAWTRSRRALLAVASVGAVASAVAMALMYHAGTDPSRLYYGTGTRAQDLLLGAVAAIALAGRSGPRTRAARRGVAWLTVAAAVAFAVEWSQLDSSSWFPYRGGFFVADACVAVVVVGVVLVPRSPLARVLALRPLVYVGKVSYGLYLWHWPIFLVLDEARTGLTGWALFAVRSAVSLAFAALSARFVENPIRRGALRSWRAWVATPASAGAVAVLVLVATVASPVASGTAAANPARPSGLSPGLRAALSARGAFTSHPVRFMLLGDSMAVTLAIGLRQDDRARWGVDPLFRWSALGCDLDPTLKVRVSGHVGPATPGCKGWQTTWPKLIASQHPEVVGLLLGRWESVDHYYDGRWTHVGEPLWDAHLRADLVHAVHVLSAGGAKVMLFTEPYVHPPESPDGTPYPENLPSRVDAYNAVARTVATSVDRTAPGTVTVFDLHALLDPGGHYTARIDGITVRWADGIHISRDGGLWLRSRILPAVDALALGRPVQPSG